MGRLRGGKRKTIVVSSDVDEGGIAHPSPMSEDGERSVRGTGGSGNPKTARPQQPTPAPSAHVCAPQASPQKSKGSKPQGTRNAKESANSSGKPIYSFFNAAIQRQQLSQPSASPEKQIAVEDFESIQDDSGDDGSSLQLSKGSSTALALRKRKLQQRTGAGQDANLPAPLSQKFRKTSDDGRTPSFSFFNDDKRPWTEQFAPVDLSELAVHKRKVADVRQWLETTLSGKRQKVLVLKGGAGTGKTATVRLLARDLNATIAEWQNPAGFDAGSEGFASSALHFQDFVSRASKSQGLTLSSDSKAMNHENSVHTDGQPGRRNARQFLLIEEYPNTFSRSSATLQAFRSTLLQYISGPPIAHGSPTPVILIISETLLSTNTAAADSFTAHRLLGPELVNHPYINIIEFNAVAPTILTKALETVVVKEARRSGRRKTPGPRVLKRLAETGDIRSAVSSLEFLCLRGDDDGTWSSKVQFTKPKKTLAEPAMTKAEEEVLKLVTNRESSLGIFHAVGRVVYNNRVDPPKGESLAQPPPWLPQYRRTKIPEHDVDMLIDELGAETSTFIAGLHENYALSCSAPNAEDCLNSLSGCVDDLSDADLLMMDRFSFGTRAFSGSAMDSLRQDEMAFQVAVRGLLLSLPSPVHRQAPPGRDKRDARHMFYPASLKLWKAREEIEGLIELLTARAQCDGMLDGKAASIRKTASGNGIDSWKRSGTLGRPAETQEGPDEPSTALHGITSAEMLLERLPYHTQIVGANESGPHGSPLLQQLLKVTRVSERSTATEIDNEPDQDDAQPDDTFEAWSTDQPDADAPSAALRGAKGQGKSKQGTGSGELAIPVEHDVARLVLEDDDIEDD